MEETLPTPPPEIVKEFAEIKCPTDPTHLIMSSIFTHQGRFVSEQTPGVTFQFNPPTVYDYSAFCTDCAHKNDGFVKILRTYHFPIT